MKRSTFSGLLTATPPARRRSCGTRGPRSRSRSAPSTRAATCRSSSATRKGSSASRASRSSGQRSTRRRRWSCRSARTSSTSRPARRRPGLYNAVVQGIELKIVADKGSTPHGFGYMPLLVRADLAAHFTYKDLKGMKVAEPAQGTTTSSTLNDALEQANLAYGDVTHEYLGFPNHVAAFAGQEHRRQPDHRTVGDAGGAQRRCRALRRRRRVLSRTSSWRCCCTATTSRRRTASSASGSWPPTSRPCASTTTGSRATSAPGTAR